ncbi:Oxysterol-binding protein-related protein 3A [Tetrabaena socialis]|uniref:Oxysterol-binding protein-related protein 3A n=1 Tax=Tetrabaena socialis TaxID=47790 RepID=A0A2J7ZR34_9CHLO|nr:Oxysterol-binding protein-related protein 3A [Tetrabaena socialis]|eukprot:PNH02735.1 Oxysterol-binding protein-related protein 3A [Tetrabaena socialis]
MGDAAPAEAAPAAGGTLLGTLYQWGGSVVSYAQQQINSIMGWEDLEVVDPEAEKAKKGEDAVADGLLEQERKQAWGTKQFQQYIGADVTSLLSVPVWIMEPFTILQKAAEIMEYTELLDAADAEEDDFDRCGPRRAAGGGGESGGEMEAPVHAY